MAASVAAFSAHFLAPVICGACVLKGTDGTEPADQKFKLMFHSSWYPD